MTDDDNMCPLCGKWLDQRPSEDDGHDRFLMAVIAIASAVLCAAIVIGAVSS